MSNAGLHVAGATGFGLATSLTEVVPRFRRFLRLECVMPAEEWTTATSTGASHVPDPLEQMASAAAVVEKVLRRSRIRERAVPPVEAESPSERLAGSQPWPIVAFIGHPDTTGALTTKAGAAVCVPVSWVAKPAGQVAVAKLSPSAKAWSTRLYESEAAAALAVASAVRATTGCTAVLIDKRAAHHDSPPRGSAAAATNAAPCGVGEDRAAEALHSPPRAPPTTKAAASPGCIPKQPAKTGSRAAGRVAVSGWSSRANLPGSGPSQLTPPTSPVASAEGVAHVGDAAPQVPPPAAGAAESLRRAREGVRGAISSVLGGGTAPPRRAGLSGRVVGRRGGPALVGAARASATMSGAAPVAGATEGRSEGWRREAGAESRREPESRREAGLEALRLVQAGLAGAGASLGGNAARRGAADRPDGEARYAARRGAAKDGGVGGSRPASARGLVTVRVGGQRLREQLGDRGAAGGEGDDTLLGRTADEATPPDRPAAASAGARPVGHGADAADADSAAQSPPPTRAPTSRLPTRRRVAEAFEVAAHSPGRHARARPPPRLEARKRQMAREAETEARVAGTGRPPAEDESVWDEVGAEAAGRTDDAAEAPRGMGDRAARGREVAEHPAAEPRARSRGRGGVGAGGVAAAAPAPPRLMANGRRVELALRHVCLAAPTVREQLEEALGVLEARGGGTFVILLRSRAGTAFKGLYQLAPAEADAGAGAGLCLVRVAGGGPAVLQPGDARAVLKFDTAGKRFVALPTRAIDSADAIALR